MKQFAVGYIALVVIMSILTLLTYGFDKYRAKRNGWRVPEKRLHIMALLGGWPGAMLAQKMFRHKTQKTAFRIVFWICVILNLAVLGGGLYLTREM